VVATTESTDSTLQGARHRRLQLRWWPLPDLSPAPPGGPPLTSSTLVVAAARPAASTPRGPAIDVFNFGGGRCRKYRQHPPRRPAINIFNFGGGRCRTCHQHPQGAHHRCLQLRWWPLLEIPIAPPREPAINVFNFGGGHCRICRQHPLGNIFNFGGRHFRKYRRHLPVYRRRHFLALMVGALGPPALAPPGGSPSTAKKKVQDSRAGRLGFGPTCGFAASPEVGLCRHPEDRVSPHTSFKSRQGTWRASMRCHVSCTFRPHLPAEVDSGATTCPTAPDLTSLLR
jgi:hypothetical protein